MGDGYNPYENRDVEAPLSNFDAFFSLLKCVIGTGILAMPLAFKYAGLIGGPILTTICTGLLIYGMQLLIKCMVESSRQNKVDYLTYPETMVYACSVGPSWCRYCAKASGLMVDVILGFSHYGINVVYIVFVAVNFKQVVDYYLEVTDVRLICLAVGLLGWPLFMLRHLKYLVPSNIIASALIYLGLAGIFWYLFQHLLPLSTLDLFPKPLDIPLFMGIVMFATSSVGVMLAIESKMAHPEKYLGIFGILSLGAVVIIVTNILFGFFGYWHYDGFVGASITLNLPSNQILAQLIRVFFALGIFLTYPLSGWVTIDIIMNHYVLKNREVKHPHMIEYVIRSVFVVLSTLNAMAFPNLGPLLALVGAFAISLLNLIFPCCIELSLRYHESYGPLKWVLWKDLLIILFGLIVLGYGSYSAIVDMIREYGGKGVTP